MCKYIVGNSHAKSIWCASNVQSPWQVPGRFSSFKNYYKKFFFDEQVAVTNSLQLFPIFTAKRVGLLGPEVLSPHGIFLLLLLLINKLLTVFGQKLLLLYFGLRCVQEYDVYDMKPWVSRIRLRSDSGIFCHKLAWGEVSASCDGFVAFDSL